MGHCPIESCAVFNRWAPAEAPWETLDDDGEEETDRADDEVSRRPHRLYPVKESHQCNDRYPTGRYGWFRNCLALGDVAGRVRMLIITTDVHAEYSVTSHCYLQGPSDGTGHRVSSGERSASASRRSESMTVSMSKPCRKVSREV